MGTHSSEQEDYLIRIIKQAAEAIRRLRGKLTESAAAIPAILAEGNVAMEQLLGAQADMLSRLDAETAVRLVGSSRRAQLWADLVELEADARDIGGDAISAATKRARAVALRAAADRFETKNVLPVR
jgi:spermidine/putrescine-binding protein